MGQIRRARFEPPPLGVGRLSTNRMEDDGIDLRGERVAHPVKDGADVEQLHDREGASVRAVSYPSW
jgi:hypothetical protein